MNTTKYEGKRRSPLDAIRAFCMWCCGGSALEVRLCPSAGCAFSLYRAGTIPARARRSLVKIIKARCLDCIPDGAADCDAFQALEHHPPCPCWPFRMGKNPNIGAATRKKRKEQGKRQMDFAAPRPESGPRITRKPMMEGMPHER